MMAENPAEKTADSPEAFNLAWRKTELARHAKRPYPMEIVQALFTEFSEIHGDRAFGDDPAMCCGMALFEGEQALVVANVKGRTTKEKIRRNFGMPNPEGYRKALRAMKFAEKFGRPIFSFIDLTGASPGLGAEERGQAEAIARNLREMARLRTPIVATITGEGGSGGALALAVADRVLMLENAVYSVISPEACASIMWRDASKRAEAAEALRTNSENVLHLGCVDAVIPEPPGGAQDDPERAAALVGDALRQHLGELKQIPLEELVKRRFARFRNIAQYYREP